MVGPAAVAVALAVAGAVPVGVTVGEGDTSPHSNIAVGESGIMLRLPLHLSILLDATNASCRGPNCPGVKVPDPNPNPGPDPGPDPGGRILDPMRGCAGVSAPEEDSVHGTVENAL